MSDGVSYRKEIDGLRALAVLPVILFHAGSGYFPGGFVGVDVFFVISGFLITSNIVLERRRGEFSFLHFYERRARRILPALYLVMLISLPFAWLWMLPDYLENFGQSLVATVLFANNVLLWLTTGYFDLESEFKPLVHTWSLGVEEQYYIAFPIVFGLLWAWARTWILPIAASAIGIALIATTHWYISHPMSVFYLLPFRIWEILIGVCAAMVTTGRNAEAIKRARVKWSGSLLSTCGLCMIATSIFVLTKDTGFFGLAMLLPSMGAGLVLLFAGEGNFAGRILGARPLVGVGVISYSAYLWHQPLFAFARLRSLHEPGAYTLLALGVVALLLAYPTWKWIEQPFRKRDTISRLQLWAFAGIVGGFLLSLGYSMHINSGFPQHWAELQTDIHASGRGLNAEYNRRVFKYENIPFTDPNRTNVLVLGNSFARDVINAGLENGYFSHHALSYSAWMPVNLRDPETIPQLLREQISKADVLIIGNPPVNLETWASDAKVLSNLGAKRIVVIGTKNFGWNMNAVMLLPADVRYTYKADVLPPKLEENQACKNAIPPEQFVDLLGLLEGSDGRVAVFTEKNRLISQDREHLTKDGAKYVGERLFQHPLLRDLR